MDVKEGEEGLLLDDDAQEPKPLFTQQIRLIGKGIATPVPTHRQLSSEVNGMANGTHRNGSFAVSKTATKDTMAAADLLWKGPKTLSSIAKVLRSKLAGPYEVTFDVMFSDEAIYRIVKDSDFLSKGMIAHLYGIAESDVIWAGFFDQARAFKATIPRMRKGKRIAAGGFMESDAHASQQHVPLWNLKLTEDIVSKIGAL